MSIKAIAVDPQNPAGFIEISPEMPVPGQYDLLVEVKAASVNPVDTKVHAGLQKSGLQQPRVLGWDASGIVVGVGSSVSGFKPGDEVWYAGDITRPGSNSSHQLIDSRIAAHKPRSLNWAELLSRRMLVGIVSSLDDIANVAHAVRRDRTFGLRVPSAPIAELHELSNDFNGLLDELEAWQAHLKQENDSLAHRATHDSLTGLPNRAFFEGRLSRALGDIESPAKLAVLFIDGDRFKEVNDSYGHAAGDAVLTTIAGRIRAQLRETDLVARLGGDEFAVLLAPVHGTEDVLQIADNIIDCMTQPVILPNDETVITSLSIGIALYPDHASTPQGLLHEADDAMYQAKHRYNGGWRLAIHK